MLKVDVKTLMNDFWDTIQYFKEDLILLKKIVLHNATLSIEAPPKVCFP